MKQLGKFDENGILISVFRSSDPSAKPGEDGYEELPDNGVIYAPQHYTKASGKISKRSQKDIKKSLEDLFIYKPKE